jgi:hypothetical protein
MCATPGRRTAQRAGLWAGLGTVEEGTCDRCRRYVGCQRLTPTVLRVDLWVVHLAVCPRCERTVLADGAQLLGGGAA